MSRWGHLLIALGAALAVGLAAQPLVIRWLRRRGLVDVPNHRSSHQVSTPRGGGIAVALAFALGAMAAGSPQSQVTGLVLGSVVLGAVGLVDDLRGLQPGPRLLMQLGVGGALGYLLPYSQPWPVAALLGGLWVAAYVNAFNFMDGINGISALTGIVAGLSYALMGAVYESGALLVVGGALAGASLSFLPFNLLRARVFLGDVGSYSMGFVIAGLAWMAWGSEIPLMLAVAPTAVYLADTGSTLVRRRREGASLTQAHRSHVYQRLVAEGHSHATVALVVAGLQAAVVAMVWWGQRSGWALLGIAAAALAIMGYALVPFRNAGPTR